MWFNSLGQYDDDLFVLGTSDVPIYLLRVAQDEWALVEGGVTCDVDRVRGQLRAVVGDLRRVRHWIITHSHYDHCGMVARLLPSLGAPGVIASDGVRRAFASASARRVIATLNDALGAASRHGEGASAPPTLEDVPVSVVADGDLIPLGARHRLRVLATPGHASCQISLIDGERAFVSDAMGELVRPDAWCPLVFDDLAAYRATLSRLAALGARVLCIAHNGILDGPEAELAPRIAREDLEGFVDDVRLRIRGQGEDPEAVAASLSRRLRTTSQGFVSADLHLRSMRRMISLILGQEPARV